MEEGTERHTSPLSNLNPHYKIMIKLDKVTMDIQQKLDDKLEGLQQSIPTTITTSVTEAIKNAFQQPLPQVQQMTEAIKDGDIKNSFVCNKLFPLLNVLNAIHLFGGGFIPCLSDAYIVSIPDPI